MKIPDTFKNLNIADYFSIYRIVAIVPIITFIVLNKKEITGWLLLISFITDAIDGYAARKKDIATSRGAKLDSIGDALTLILGFISFYIFSKEFFKEHLLIIVIMLCLFLIQILVSLIKFRSLSSFHTYSAKITAILLSIFLVTNLIYEPIKILFYVAFISGILEALEETALTLILKESKENVKGIFWIKNS